MTDIIVSQDNGELQWLTGILCTYQPVRMLEIGTMEGGSLRAFIQGLPSIRKAVSVDIFYPQWDKRHTWAEWSTNVEIVTIQGDCQTPKVEASTREHAPFDFVFIDADHQYHCMKHDWEVYGGMCRAGGIVAFHDISNVPHEGFGGWKLWPEIRSINKTTERIDFPDRHWGGIGIVFK